MAPLIVSVAVTPLARLVGQLGAASLRALIFLVIIAICLGTAPALAETASPDQIAQPLAAGQHMVLEAHLPGSEPSSEAGSSVALSSDGTTALVGAPSEDCEDGPDCGAVQVLVRNGGTWTEQARLTASDGAAEARFGSLVALSGDGSMALVGTLQANCSPDLHCSAAYVFVRSGQSWSESQKLLPPGAGGFDVFVQSVDLSIDGSIALIGGTTLESCGGQIVNCGIVFVFTRTGGSWVETARFTATSPSSFDGFGTSVALSADGSIALIAAPRECEGTVCGKVYVLVRSGAIWTEDQKFNAGESLHSISLSSDGSTALVGGSSDCIPPFQCGESYVFARNGGQWTLSASLNPPLESNGSGVLAGDARHALVMGGEQFSCSGGECAVALLFVAEGGLWREKQRLTVPVQCGWPAVASVALSENADQALVGVPVFISCPGNQPGGAYVFGSGSGLLEIPVASGFGLAVLSIALAAIGTALLRR